MALRRLFSSYFYISHDGDKIGKVCKLGWCPKSYSFDVPSFSPEGGNQTISLSSGKRWLIEKQELDWLTIEPNGNAHGNYELTLGASENTTFGTREGVFTAKTIDNRFEIVFAVSQEARATEKYISVTPKTVNLDAEDSYSSLVCTFYYNGTSTQVVPSWSTNNTAVTVSADGTVTSNNTNESPLTVTVTATYVHEGDTLTSTATIKVSAATISEYLTVSPQTANIGPTGTQQLTVIYHKVVNGHETTTNVTSSANISYSSDNPSISVNGTGLVTANNQFGVTETATIDITYLDTETTATITSSPATIVETVELGPNNISLAYGNSQTLTVTYVKTVNGVETERRSITTPSQLAFTLSDNTAATMNGMNLVNQNVSTEDKTETIYVVYNGITSNTITATMVQPASLTYRLDVTADERTIKYNGTTQMRATYVTVVNGTDYSSEVINPSNVTWSENSSFASISNAGLLTGSNNSGASRTVMVTGSYNGVTDTEAVTLERRPGIRVAASSDWHLTSGAGECTFTVYWSNLKQNTTITFDDANLDSYSPASISITSSNYTGGSQTVTAEYLANTGADSRRLYLYATGTGQYNESLTSNDYYEQAGYNPTITYELVVTPGSATLGYGDTAALTVIYYVVTDGVRDAGTDVTSAATYSAGNSAATVSNAGVVTGNNTGTSNTTTTIQVSYGNADPEDVTITSRAAERTKTLTVTAANNSISSTGSTTVSAVYREYIGSTMVVEETPNATAVTWSIASGSSYASVSNNGRVTGTNGTESNQTVKVKGSYNGATGSTDITVRAVVVTYDSIRFASGSSLTNTITSVSLSSATSKNNIYVVETRHGASDTSIDDTKNASYTVYSGTTALGTFSCSNAGTKYSDDYITIAYSSSNALTITSSNSDTNAKSYRLTATDDNETATLNISVAAGADVITYRDIYFVSGANQYDISSVSIGATGSKNKIFVYRDRYVNGVYSNQVNDTTDASYTIYSGTSVLGTFTCSSTGQKFSDANITITYTGTTNGIVIECNNITESSKAYRLVASHDSYTDELGITIQAGSAEYRNLYFVSGANQYDLTTVSLTSAETKNEVYVYTDKYISGTKVDSVDANQIVDFSVYSGSTLLGTFDCKTTSGIKFDDNNGLRITYSIHGLGFISQNEYGAAKTYTLTANYGSYSDSITINVAASITRMIDISVVDEVTSNAGGNCGSYTVSWTGLTVGSYIDVTAENASVDEYEFTVTATTGSKTYPGKPTVLENPGASRSVRLVATWRDNTAITDSEQWSQMGGYVPPVTTYSLILAVYTTGGTNVGGTVTVFVNGGAANTGPLTPTRTITGLHSGDTVDYIFSPSSSSKTYLKYSGTTTMPAAQHYVSGVAVEDSFVFQVRAYDHSDTENNVFHVVYSTKNGGSGSEYLTTNGTSVQTITTNLGSNYVVTADDYFRYNVEQTAGRINVSGWDMSGTNGTASNISLSTLNNNRLYNVNIAQGKAGNIAIEYRGSYPEPSTYTGTINFDASDATNWSSCNILLNNVKVLEGNVSPDSGTFTYTSTGQTFSCRVGGGLGDSAKYKRFSMEILDSNGNTLWDGPCRYIHASSLDYTALTLNAKQLNNSTWYLHDLANYGDISIYAAQSQTGVTGNTVAGYRNSVNVQFNWTGLTTDSTMTVTLPSNMTYQGSSTISIPINSSTGSVTRLVNMPYNSGTTATGTDITYSITAVATDVNSDVIHGRGTITHNYQQIINNIISLQPTSSIPYPGNNGAYGHIIWGQLPNDNLEIEVKCTNCSYIDITWASDLRLDSFNLTNATDGHGHTYVEVDNVIYPDGAYDTITLLTDVSQQIHGASEGSYSGTLTMTGYDGFGNSSTITIEFDS